MSYNYVFEFISYIFSFQIPHHFTKKIIEDNQNYHAFLFNILQYYIVDIRDYRMQSIYDERQRKFDLELVLGDLGKWDNL